MKKINLILVVMGLILFGLFSFSFADESLTITTYYPSPYGSYNELRAKRMAIGDNYVNAVSYPWGTGSAGDTVSSAADLLVEGRVGVGVTKLNASLQVKGAVRVSSGLPSASATMPAEFGWSSGTTGTNWSNTGYTFDYGGNTGIFLDKSPGGQDDFGGGDIVFMTDNEEFLRMTDHNGSYGYYLVGIGTTAPTAKLEVNGVVRLDSVVGIGSTGSDVGLGTTDYNSWRSMLYIGGDGTSNNWYGIRISSGVGDDFVVTNAGNVGIGTSDPSEPSYSSATKSGNLDANDVYIRKTGVWVSQIAQTCVGWNGEVTRDVNDGDTFATCPMDYPFMNGFTINVADSNAGQTKLICCR